MGNKESLGKFDGIEIYRGDDGKLEYDGGTYENGEQMVIAHIAKLVLEAKKSFDDIGMTVDELCCRVDALESEQK